MMDDLKLLITVIKDLKKLRENIRELIDTGEEQDPISQALADEYGRVIQQLETLGKRGEQQQDGSVLQEKLLAGAKALEEISEDLSLSSVQQSRLLDQASKLRDKAALLAAQQMYNFSNLLNPQEFKDFVHLIEKGKDAVQDRKALKETLDTVVDLAVLAAMVAAKL
jgi:hypothetical protein